MSIFKARIVKVLSVIYRLIQSNSYATKRFFIIDTFYLKLKTTYNKHWGSEVLYSHRDIFYNDTQLFASQLTVDHIVDDISCLLKVPRRSLHVVRQLVLGLQ